MHTLKNDVLTVEVSEHGAELHSIRKGATEYLWQADPKFWARHSPVLFPIVGSVWDKLYRVDGKVYELGQHGFARDMDFVKVEGNDTEVFYRLESDEETLKKYPWPFRLEIGYKLKDNAIEVIWRVYNPPLPQPPWILTATLYTQVQICPKSRERSLFITQEPSISRSRRQWLPLPASI